MTTTTNEITATACPRWCTVEHDRPGGFHAGPNLIDGVTHPGRLWQADQDGAPAGVVIAGELLTAAQAHELGMALVRAADELHRAPLGVTR